MIKLAMKAGLDERVSTPCPFGKRTGTCKIVINIGSGNCAACRYHENHDKTHVLCSAGEYAPVSITIDKVNMKLLDEQRGWLREVIETTKNMKHLEALQGIAHLLEHMSDINYHRENKK